MCWIMDGLDMKINDAILKLKHSTLQIKFNINVTIILVSL